MLTFTQDYIWDKYIYKSAQCFIDNISEKQKMKFNIEIRDKKIMKKLVFQEYNTQKNILKDRYHICGNGSSGRIDQHKIASCICYSLIKNKIIAYNITKDLPTEIFYANYIIAFNSSIGIIYSFLCDYYIKHKKNKELKLLLNNQTIFLPKTEHDEYDLCIIKMLLLNDLYGNNFDLLAYSNIMFLVEEYNKEYIMNNL